VDLHLKAGTANAGRKYLMLGSLTGIDPGFALPGGLATMPLNWDSYSDLILALLNSAVFSNFCGPLDSQGQGTATLNLPPVPGFAGTVMYYAYALNNPFDYVSNAAAMEIIP